MPVIRQNQCARSTGDKPLDTEDIRSAFWDFGLLAAVTLVLIVYVSAYILLVRPGARIWFAPTGKTIVVLADYHGVPGQIFAPIHYLDRNLIRPQFWGGAGRTWTVQKQTAAIGNWPNVSRIILTNAPGGYTPQGKPKSAAGVP